MRPGYPPAGDKYRPPVTRPPVTDRQPLVSDRHQLVPDRHQLVSDRQPPPARPLDPELSPLPRSVPGALSPEASTALSPAPGADRARTAALNLARPRATNFTIAEIMRPAAASTSSPTGRPAGERPSS